MQAQASLLSWKASGSTSTSVSGNKQHFIPATVTNLLRTIAKRRRTEATFSARLLPHMLHRSHQQLTTHSQTPPVVSSNSNTNKNNNSENTTVRDSVANAIQDFEDRTNRWPLQDRLAQTRNSITRFQPTLIRDVQGSLQFDRAAYNKSMRCLGRIEEESQLPQPPCTTSGGGEVSWCGDGEAILASLRQQQQENGAASSNNNAGGGVSLSGDRTILEEGSPATTTLYKPHGVLSSQQNSEMNNHQNVSGTATIDTNHQSPPLPPWATALGFFQNDTVETGRAMTADVRTRVMNVLSMAAQRRHEEYNSLSGASKFRSHPPLPLFLRWWVLLTVERDVGMSKQPMGSSSAPGVFFNPFSFNFNNGTAMACPWAVEWTPTCKRLLGRQWTQFGSPDEQTATRRSPRRNSDDRALVNELRQQQALPATLGKDLDFGDDDSSSSLQLTTFFPRDPALLRELLSSAPKGVVTGNRHANAAVIPMLLRYNMWAEAARFVQIERGTVGLQSGSGAITTASSSQEAVADSWEGAVYEVLMGRQPSITDGAMDDAGGVRSEGYNNPLFAPVYHGDSVATLLKGSVSIPTPRWAVALQIVQTLSRAADGGLTREQPDHQSVNPLLVDFKRGTVCKAGISTTLLPPSPADDDPHLTSQSTILDHSELMYLTDREVLAPSVEVSQEMISHHSDDEEESPSLRQEVKLTTTHSMKLTSTHAAVPSPSHHSPSPVSAAAPSPVGPPTFTALAVLVSQRFGQHAQRETESGGYYPWKAATEMINNLKGVTSATSSSSSELSLLSLRLLNIGANQQLLSARRTHSPHPTILQLCINASQTAGGKDASVDLKARRGILSSGLSLFGQLPPRHQQSPFLIRQALVAAVEVAEQHLTECLVASVTKVEGYQQMQESNPNLQTVPHVDLLYKSLSPTQQASFANILNLLCGSISERYIAPLGYNGGDQSGAELLLIPASTLNKVVQLCATFCPSLRYLKISWNQEKTPAAISQLKKMYLASANVTRSKNVAEQNIFGDKETNPVSPVFPQKSQAHLQQKCAELDMIDGVDAYSATRNLLTLVSEQCPGRVTETSAKFLLFCQNVQKTKPSITFESAASNATVPQLQAFAKSLLQSGSWKKALRVSKYVEKRSGGSHGGTWQEALQSVAKS